VCKSMSKTSPSWSSTNTELPTMMGDVGKPPETGTDQAALSPAMLRAVIGEPTARREFEASWSGEGQAATSRELGEVWDRDRPTVDAPLTAADPTTTRTHVIARSNRRLTELGLFDLHVRVMSSHQPFAALQEKLCAEHRATGHLSTLRSAPGFRGPSAHGSAGRDGESSLGASAWKDVSMREGP
jgi:hypothetical protein